MDGIGKITILQVQNTKERLKTINEWKGKIIFSDGGSYEGSWLNGVIEGNGIAKYANGLIYEGAFSHDKNNGFGTMTYSDGYVYKGNWKNGIQEGDGEEIFPNGTVYKGKFKNNQTWNRKHENGKWVLILGTGLLGK